MVRAGEAAGMFDDILKRLALQRKRMLLYAKGEERDDLPMILMIITVLAFFWAHAVLSFKNWRYPKEPWRRRRRATSHHQAMLAVSSFMLNYWYIVIPGFCLAVWGLLLYIKTPAGRKQFHHLVLRVPAVNGVIRKVIVARFSRTFLR